MTQILISKSEQEKNVLTAIVGKFTDRNKEILAMIPKYLSLLLKVSGVLYVVNPILVS